MLDKVVVDTGALLALLDRSDRHHAACAAVFRDLRLPLLTSTAVLTELFHLLHPKELEIAWAFLQSGAITIFPIQDSDLAALHGLMSKYADLPMDFADATLVHLAATRGLRTVFTVDRKDFSVYRVAGHQKLRVVP